MRLHFALSRMTIGSYYTWMIHTFTRLTLLSLILPNSQNAFYNFCTYTANSYKKRWPNHQYNIRPFKRVLKNKICLHYNKQILLPSLITIYQTKPSGQPNLQRPLSYQNIHSKDTLRAGGYCLTKITRVRAGKQLQSH